MEITNLWQIVKRLKDSPVYLQAKMLNDLANSIFAQMVEKGITVKELAERAGFSEDFIVELVSDCRLTDILSLGEYAKIAHALDCDVRIELVPMKEADGR